MLIISETKRFKSYTAKFQNYIDKGKKLQENNPLELPKVFSKWVIKEVSGRESVHSFQNASYCNLGKSEGRVKIGFLVVGSIPFDSREATDEEILQIDAYRRTHRIYPFPLREAPQKLNI